MRIFLVSLFAVSIFLPILSVEAVTISLKKPFGGTITVPIPCTCSNISHLAVPVLLAQPPYFGFFLWKVPTTIPKANYFPFPGGGILGFYKKGGTCRVGVAPYCYVVPITGTITTVGTGGI